MVPGCIVKGVGRGQGGMEAEVIMTAGRPSVGRRELVVLENSGNAVEILGYSATPII